jgi:hypothetical protein
MKICSLILALWYLFLGSSSYAGNPDICSPWFSREVIFDNAIPKGITIDHSEPSEYQYDEKIEGPPIVIKNSGTTPIYLLSNNERSIKLKIVNNKVYYTNYRVRLDNISSKNIRWNEYRAHHYQITPLILEDLTGIKIIGNCSDNRPDNISAPLPQEFSINTVYGDQILRINGKIVYQLNKDYDPHAQANSPIYQHFVRAEQNDSLKKVPIIGGCLVIANNHRVPTTIVAIVVISCLVGSLFIHKKS